MDRILQRALSKRAGSGNISHDQLIEVGRELGLTEQEIERAIDEEQRYGAIDEAREEVIEKQRKGWREHFSWYVGVNAITMGLNFMQEDGRFTWALGMLFGWGIGMAIHTYDTFFPSEKKLNKAAKKLLRKREERMLKE